MVSETVINRIQIVGQPLRLPNVDEADPKSAGAPAHSKTWPQIRGAICPLAFWSAALLRRFAIDGCDPTARG